MSEYNRENHHDEHHVTIQSLTEERDSAVTDAEQWHLAAARNEAEFRRLGSERNELQSTVDKLRAALEEIVNRHAPGVGEADYDIAQAALSTTEDREP